MTDSEFLAPYPALSRANDETKQILVAFMRRIFDEFRVIPSRPTSRGGAYYRDPAPFMTILSATRSNRKVNMAVAFKATPEELSDLAIRPVSYQGGIYAYLNVGKMEDIETAMIAARRSWQSMNEQLARRSR